MQIELPEEVVHLYEIVSVLEQRYPGRKFTLDGHLVGSLGEVIAEQTFRIRLHPASHPIHDARSFDGKEVQVKLTGGKQIALRAKPDWLLVMKIVNPAQAEVAYNGPGLEPWNAAGKMQKNGQRSLSISKLMALDQAVSDTQRIALRGNSP
jgi:hypothetical protein